MLTIEQTSLDALMALTCAAVPWLARRLSNRTLAAGLALALGASIAAGVSSLPLYPWSDVLVALLALTAGLLLGRALPGVRSLLILLLVLSALDVLQIALTGGLTPIPLAFAPSHAFTAPTGPLLYGNFLLPLPGSHYLIGIFDLLVLTAIAEYWRRRGGAYLYAVLPGLIGFALVTPLARLTHLGGWPLLPFFTAGWLCAEVVYRAFGKAPGPSARPSGGSS